MKEQDVLKINIRLKDTWQGGTHFQSGYENTYNHLGIFLCEVSAIKYWDIEPHNISSGRSYQKSTSSCRNFHDSPYNSFRRLRPI